MKSEKKVFKFTHKGVKFTIVPDTYSHVVTGGTPKQNSEAALYIAKKLWRKNFGNANVIRVHTDFWYDKTYGNSYGTANAAVYNGTEKVASVRTGFQYGYGAHHNSQCLKEIRSVFFGLVHFSDLGVNVFSSESDRKKREIDRIQYCALTFHK